MVTIHLVLLCLHQHVDDEQQKQLVQPESTCVACVGQEAVHMVHHLRTTSLPATVLDRRSSVLVSRVRFTMCAYWWSSRKLTSGVLVEAAIDRHVEGSCSNGLR